MKTLIVTFLLLIGRLYASENLEFAGLLTVEGQRTFVMLVDKTDKVSSPWIEEGQDWRGYRVAKIERLNNSITVSKGPQTATLFLRESMVVRGQTAAPSPFHLVHGEVSQDGSRTVYSSNSIIQIGPFRLSSRSGTMASEAACLVGDLTVEKGSSGAQLRAGGVEIKEGKVIISARRIKLPSEVSDGKTSP